MDKCWCGNNKFSSYSHDYWNCENCHTLVDKENISYDPDNIQDNRDFYGKEYWKTKMVDAAGVKNIGEVVDLYLNTRAVYWLKEFFRFCLPGKGNIAEVGCGLGQFSYLLKECCYNQIAYEISPEVCNYIRDELKINIQCSAFKKDENKYDAIAAFDVLEHFTDPREFMADAAASLKPNGILFIQTPCYDPSLSYESMLDAKPRFKGLLKPAEHIYLFSKQSVKQFLSEYDFDHVLFLDAFFGNDYDMFFAASRKPIHEYSPEEIDTALNSLEHGRLIKALINIWTEKKNIDVMMAELENNQKENIKQIDQLTVWLKESETDRAARGNQIDDLTKQLIESNADREARAVQIDDLTKQLIESNTDREARAVQIDDLTKQLIESNADRESRAVQIENLTAWLKESNIDRDARWVQIENLTKMVNDSNAEKTNLLIQNNELSMKYKESEQNCSVLEHENSDLSNRIKNLENTLAENESMIAGKEEQIEELSEKLYQVRLEKFDAELLIDKLNHESVFSKISRNLQKKEIK